MAGNQRPEVVAARVASIKRRREEIAELKLKLISDHRHHQGMLRAQQLDLYGTTDIEWVTPPTSEAGEPFPPMPRKIYAEPVTWRGKGALAMTGRYTVRYRVQLRADGTAEERSYRANFGRKSCDKPRPSSA